MTRASFRSLLCVALVVPLACGSSSWEEYMEAGYEAQQGGRYVEAEELFLVAFRQAEGFAADDLRRAETLDNLADVYRSQGRGADAEAFYRQALELRTDILGAWHQRVAIGLDNLAAYYLDQGAYAAAEPLYWRALEVSEANLGPDHPDVATILLGLATVHIAQLELADAERFYQRALRIREQSLGPNHLGVAEILEGYAEVLRQTGREVEGAAMAARARSIRPEEYVPVARP